MAEKILPYDPAASLTTPEAVEYFVNDALESGDAAYIAHALGIAHAAFEEYNTRQNMHPALRPANWQREHHQELVERRNDLDIAAAQVVDAAYARAMEHRDRLAANRVLGLRDRPVADYADPDPPPRLPDVASLVSAARPGPAAGIAHAA